MRNMNNVKDLSDIYVFRFSIEKLTKNEDINLVIRAIRIAHFQPTRNGLRIDRRL